MGGFLCVLNIFFKFLHNVTNKNIYFYKGSSGQNIILPEGNQMFNIFKAMSILIKAVADLSFRGWSSCWSFFYWAAMSHALANICLNKRGIFTFLIGFWFVHIIINASILKRAAFENSAKQSIVLLQVTYCIFSSGLKKSHLFPKPGFHNKNILANFYIVIWIH